MTNKTPALTAAPKVRSAHQGDTTISNLYVTLEPSVALTAANQLIDIPAGAVISGSTRVPYLDYFLNPGVGVEVEERGLGNATVRFLAAA